MSREMLLQIHMALNVLLLLAWGWTLLQWRQALRRWDASNKRWWALEAARRGSREDD